MAEEDRGRASETKGIDELFQSVREFASSDRFRELLRFTAHFKKYAPYNAMLIYIQRPGARYVLPPKKWTAFNRVVAKDRCPIVILQPFSPVMYVYDVADTIVIPGMLDTFPSELAKPYDGDPDKPVRESTFTALKNHLKYWGICFGTMRTGENYSGKLEVACANDPDLDFLGDCKCPRRCRPAYSIRVCDDSTHNVQFCSVLHELGHLFCRHLQSCYDNDWSGGVRQLSHAAREFEAETVSWLVSRRLGIDNPSYRYLADYFAQNNEIPAGVSVDEILKATHLVETVLADTAVEDAWLYRKCVGFSKKVDEIKANARRTNRGGSRGGEMLLFEP